MTDPDPLSSPSPGLALVVEDLPEVRGWLVEALRAAFIGIEVGQAGNLADARAWLQQRVSEPACGGLRMALIDLGLPDGSGIELVRELAERYPDVQTVVATIYDDDAHLFPALAAGAHGYLLKEQDLRALVRQLRMIDDGIPPLSPAISRRMLEHFRGLAEKRSGGSIHPAGNDQASDDQMIVLRADGPGDSPLPPEVSLSPRETEVLSYIGRGLRVTEAARVLGLTEHTVAGYVKSLYRKLNISSRAEAALEASRRGLV